MKKIITVLILFFAVICSISAQGKLLVNNSARLPAKGNWLIGVSGGLDLSGISDPKGTDWVRGIRDDQSFLIRLSAEVFIKDRFSIGAMAYLDSSNPTIVYPYFDEYRVSYVDASTTGVGIVLSYHIPIFDKMSFSLRGFAGYENVSNMVDDSIVPGEDINNMSYDLAADLFVLRITPTLMYYPGKKLFISLSLGDVSFCTGKTHGLKYVEYLNQPYKKEEFTYGTTKFRLAWDKLALGVGFRF